MWEVRENVILEMGNPGPRLSTDAGGAVRVVFGLESRELPDLVPPLGGLRASAAIARCEGRLPPSHAARG